MENNTRPSWVLSKSKSGKRATFKLLKKGILYCVTLHNELLSFEIFTTNVSARKKETISHVKGSFGTGFCVESILEAAEKAEHFLVPCADQILV